MKDIKYQSNQKFQLDAIASIVDLFEGQPKEIGGLFGTITEKKVDKKDIGTLYITDKREEIGAIFNNLVLDEDLIYENLTTIQNKQSLPVSQKLDGMNFSVEMETGTGKTYVYLRTIFELAQKYDFKKYIILVPSVAIREGVSSSIEMMRSHFEELYGSMPFDWFVYDGKKPQETKNFATNTAVQIMIMTIDSIKGDAKSRILHRDDIDALNGISPAEFIASTNPIIIMDEPQNMESDLAKVMIENLNPMVTLRYSATHRHQYNLVYRLDPIDAHEMNLVKEIVVADAQQVGSDAKPYIKLISIERDPWRAKMEVIVKSEGGFRKKTFNVRQNDDLSRLTNNEAYSDGWIINEISYEPAYIEFSIHGIMNVGETWGGNDQAIHREMIRETIREHFKKELMVHNDGLKVLSLFFIDKVSNYIENAEEENPANGQLSRWFDELYIEERSKNPQYIELFPEDPKEVKKAYFAQKKKKGGIVEMLDSKENGNSDSDKEAYNLIMKDKKRLLDQNEPTRFIFSHSALREGWDNPNVFQICMMRESGSEVERRQTIGRGLRLPVNQEGERVNDRGICQLTVIANESYADFASKLQQEYINAGIKLGVVRKEEFGKIPVIDMENETLGSKRSEEIWENLHEAEFIDKNGAVLPKFKPEELYFKLELTPEYQPYEDQIIDIVSNCRIERFVKDASKRTSRQLNLDLIDSSEFIEFWEKISKRTTYHVQVETERIIEKAVYELKNMDKIDPLQVQVKRNRLTLVRGGTRSEELGSRSANINDFSLPDIVKFLQEETSLTRKTIVDILIGSQRLQEFIENPNDFAQKAKEIFKRVLAEIIIDGIEYEQINGLLYELRELRDDGQNEKSRFKDQLYKVKNKKKTIFDYVVYDSDVEKQMAEYLDGREDVRMYVKLPDKFKINTPVGTYNPDWAIMKIDEDGNEKIYLIRETKGSSNIESLRPEEKSKIKCGKRHFEAIGIDDFAKSSPGNWKV